jgi:putative phosphoesterase
MEFVIGVISDTHGLLRPQAIEALRGSQLIIHAGDVGAAGIVERLAEIAPVRAVRGNVDKGAWAEALPLVDVVDAAGLSIYVLHDRKQLDLSPHAAGFAAVISGHSHQPRQETSRGVLYFNPGSAGPRRFRLPVSVGRLHLADGRIRGELIKLPAS